MGAWWQIKLGRQNIPVGGKNHVPDALMLIFTGDDRLVDVERARRIQALEAEVEQGTCHTVEEGDESIWGSHLVQYRAPVSTLRARLALQGFGAARVRGLASAYFETEFGERAEDGADDPRDAWPEGRTIYPDSSAVAAAVMSTRGRQAAVAIRSAQPEQRFLRDQWNGLTEVFDDPRFPLALSLLPARGATTITLDLTDLIISGYMELDELPHVDARTRMVDSVTVNGPVIVITEGASDVRWMRRALEVAAPEVSHLFRFLDFTEFKSPGGTDRVVSLTKGMASAGVTNRTIAVLDNDTAGLEAARQLSTLPLPDHFRIATLPDVAYARNYPTLGPEGVTHSDVNGRAVTIEFMFGIDVLRDAAEDRLFPVRWQSWIPSAGKYQGRLRPDDKEQVRGRLDEAFADGRTPHLSSQVVQGCQRLAKLLLAAAEPPQHVGASEFSDISASWRNGLNVADR